MVGTGGEMMLRGEVMDDGLFCKHRMLPNPRLIQKFFDIFRVYGLRITIVDTSGILLFHRKLFDFQRCQMRPLKRASYWWCCSTASIAEQEA